MEQFDFLKPALSDLKTYQSCVLEWQKSMNLIAPSTIPVFWERHILDSAQVYPYIPNNAHVMVDLGSGAGFPGLVLAILNKKLNGPLNQIFLIESDIKKSIFLRETARKLSVPIQVVNKRIEQVSDIQADVLTARAVSSVQQLLTWSRSLITPSTTCLFLKGAKVDEELTGTSVSFISQKIQSLTSLDGCILKLTEVHYE